MFKAKQKYDIQNENFDLYTAKELSGLSEQQRELLPQTLAYKIFKRGSKFNYKASNKLSFFERIYALWKCLGKRVYIVVEDENGLSIEDFNKFRTESKKKKAESNPTENLVAESSFVLGSKELVDTLAYLNQLSISPIYNYLVKTKNAPQSRIGIFKKEMRYVMNFLWHYEAVKKKMNIDLDLNMPEWLVLSYLYSGDLMKSSTIHNTIFTHCYQSSKTKIKVAFSSLQNKGLISKTGTFSDAKLSITELGKDKINKAMNRYFLDF